MGAGYYENANPLRGQSLVWACAMSERRGLSGGETAPAGAGGGGARAAALAVDWGGTWCRAALVTGDGGILWQSRRANPAGGGAAEYLALAAGLLDEALAVGGVRVFGIGLAVAGPVDPESGILYQPPNLMALDGVSLKGVWQERYGLPVTAGNDANLAAMGEFHFGAGRVAAQAGRPPKGLFYVTVSTGIGGGLVTADARGGAGRLLLGANGLTAEVGHTAVDTGADAPVCQCGQRGCLEAVASGTAIANYARAAVAGEIAAPEGGGLPGESSLAALAPGEITAPAVTDAALAGDGFANAVMSRAVGGLAVGLANAVHLYNPDLIVMGGGVSAGLARLELLPRIRERICERLMSELHKAFDLVPAALGDNSGLLGAAAAAAWDPE